MSSGGSRATGVLKKTSMSKSLRFTLCRILDTTYAMMLGIERLRGPGILVDRGHR